MQLRLLLEFFHQPLRYLLALLQGDVAPDIHAAASEAFTTYAAGIEQALQPDRSFIVGDDVTLADICFVAEVALFSNERLRRAALERQGLVPVLTDATMAAFPRLTSHFARLSAHPAFAPDVQPYLEKLQAKS